MHFNVLTLHTIRITLKVQNLSSADFHKQSQTPYLYMEKLKQLKWNDTED